MPRLLLLGFAAAALPVLSAAAAPATPEEAVRLSALFERYVGHPAPGQPSSVTVVPQGESYVATLDLKRALSGLESLGFTLDPITSVNTLTPLPDGTWTVTGANSPPLTMHVGEQTFTLKSATSSFEGVYDPKLLGFRRWRQVQTGYDSNQTGPTTVQDRRTDRIVGELTGVGAEDGTVDVLTHSALTGTAADLLFRSAPAAGEPAAGNPAVPPPSQAGVSFSYAVPTGAIDVGLDRLRTRDALELWAFLVAHADRASLAAAQDDLKVLLRAGLPYTTAVKESGTFDGPTLTTPVGAVSAKLLAAGIDATGLAGTGKAAMALKIADLAVPPGQLPPWSAGLVPTALDLHVAVDGFHAAEAALAAVDDVDLRKEVVITPEQKEQVGHVFWPGGGTLTLQPSHIATRMLDLTMDGHAALGPQPSGQVTITAKGLDGEIAALQAQAASDPGAGQVLGPLVLAKNLAKPNPDGSLVWVIAFGGGPVTVNGAPLQ